MTKVLFARTVSKNDEGQRVLKWKTGPIPEMPGYSAHRDGSVRHNTPQFKGSKKDRKRLRAAAALGMEVDLPNGCVELGHDEILVKDGTDFVYDLAVAAWVPTPFYGCTLVQLRGQRALVIRACRRTAA